MWSEVSIGMRSVHGAPRIPSIVFGQGELGRAGMGVAGLRITIHAIMRIQWRTTLVSRAGDEV